VLPDVTRNFASKDLRASYSTESVEPGENWKKSDPQLKLTFVHCCVAWEINVCLFVCTHRYHKEQQGYGMA
jgi:hypothetical protein